jgi:hypothetical protein
MNNDIQTYKNNRIAEINKIYTDNYNIIINNFNNLYKQILGNRLNRNKQQLLNRLIATTNVNINSLKINYSLSISNIQKIVINLPEIINKKNALLIGINYIGTPNELGGCINDVDAIKTKLMETGFTNFITLTDKTEVKPIKQNILNAFTNLLKSGTKSGDLLCFFYSGHGSYIIDKSGDETDNRDETIVSLDMNIITDDELKSIIQNELKEGVTLLAIFDSCFSGSIFDLRYMYNDSLNFD